MPRPNERFLELSEKLGGLDPDHGRSLFYVNDPFELTHWTMNVVELLLIGGAVLGLLHAVRWFRRHDDPTNLCVWAASVVYLFVIEPVFYFPDEFGLGSLFQAVFIHNEFTAGILYGRTPLYIIALYPATFYTSFALVQRLDIFSMRHGLVLGSICVGFTNHSIYEIFDHYGPQYGWWLWDYEQNGARPTLGSVPLCSLVGFSFTGAIGLALLSQLLIADHVAREAWSGRSLTWRTLGVGALTPLTIGVGSPQVLYGMLSTADANLELVALGYYGQVLVLTAIAIPTFLRAGARTGTESARDGWIDAFPERYTVIYLMVFAALWVYASPEVLAAVDGRTDRGTPIGSLSYAILCFLGCAFVLGVIHRATREGGRAGTPIHVPQDPITGSRPRRVGDSSPLVR